MIGRIKRRISAILVLGIFFLIFMAENTSLVEVHFFHWQMKTPLAVVIISMLVIGVAVGGGWRKLTYHYPLKH
jgi:uncharacterized integral membrane protein